jgi:hypothetical protein
MMDGKGFIYGHVCFDRRFYFNLFMAALLPPPKRQKFHNGVLAPAVVRGGDDNNVVVQFVFGDEGEGEGEDGRLLGPAVSLPADVSTEGLQALVNNLKAQVRLFLFQRLVFLVFFFSLG